MSTAVFRRAAPEGTDPASAGIHGAPSWSIWPVVAVGALLRLFRLGHQPLWLDESFTWAAARAVNRSGFGVVATVDPISPGYYWLAALFSRVGGYGAFTLRLPSAIAGTVAIWLMYRLALTMTHRFDVSLCSAAFVAVSPFAIAYSQEARAYSVLMALAMVYLWMHWLVVERRESMAGYVGLAVVAALMLWFHHTGAFLFVAAGLHTVWRYRLRSTTWRWLAAHVVALLLFAPWIVLSWRLLNQQDDMPRPEILSRMPYNAMTMLVGQSFGPSNRSIREDGIASALASNAAPLGLLAICCLLAAVSIWQGRRRLRTNHWVLVASVMVATNLVLIAFVVTTHNLYHVRYAATTFPVVALLAGLAMAPGRRRLGLAVAALTFAIAMWSNANYYFSHQYAKEDFRQVPSTLHERMGVDDTLLLGNPNAVPPLAPYGFSCPARAVELRTARGLTGLASLPVNRGADAHTFTIETRQWEVASSAQIDAVLDKMLGAPIQVWNWDGVRVTERRGALVPKASAGLVLGCPK